MLLPNREPRRIPPPALPPDTSAPEHSAAPLEALSILVVDDNSTVLRAVAKSLRGEGGDVTEAETLAAARHALAERRFDLILCDWKLGDEDGFRDLLLLEEHRHAARVGLSAYYNAHAAVDAQESGAVVLL
jgi:CheY-like chemotaxis protein